jgi:hypothetical protein
VGSGPQPGGFDGWRGPSPGGAGGGGGKGVTSFNGLTGAVTGTLASIYAFGLADDPATDNLFHMPEGDWSFFGVFQTTGLPLYGIGYISNVRIAGNNNPWNYVRAFGDASGVFSPGRTYNGYSINDAAWTGNPLTLNSNPQWTMENVVFGHAADGDVARDFDVLFASRFYQYATGGWTYPNPPDNGRVSYQELDLWNIIDGGLAAITRTDGFGQTIAIVKSNQHGITPVSTASQLFSHADSAGDGTGWLASYNQEIGFENQHVKGGFTVTTLADQGDPTLDSWVSSMWSYLQNNGNTITEVIRAYADVGQKILVGGMQLPDGGAHAGAVRSDAGTAKFLYDNAAGHVYVSINGGAYALLI